MGNCICSTQKKISALLKWSPLSCAYSFTGTRLDLFSTYHERILNKNLQYIYMIIACLTLSTSLLYAWLLFAHQQLGRQFYYILPLSSACLVYHILLFAMLKVNCLRRKVQKVSGVLNIVSSLLLEVYLRSYVQFLSASITGQARNPLVSLVGGATIAIFEGTVATFYFQNSFVTTAVIWFLIGSLALAHSLRFIDNVVAVVSCLIMEYILCVVLELHCSYGDAVSSLKVSITFLSPVCVCVSLINVGVAPQSTPLMSQAAGKVLSSLSDW